jgi:hypothetical protein
MKPTCLNCEAPLPDQARFCPTCGQKTATRRLTLRDIGHELWHALTHTDHSVFGLIKALLRRPGLVAAEYVAGHRKRYFNPFTFLVVTVGLSALVIAGTGVGGFGSHPGAVGKQLQANLNLFILAQVPLLALWSRLLFLNSGRNLAENLVLVAYCSGLRSLAFLIVFVPLSIGVQRLELGFPYWAQIATYLLCWFAYLGWACAQFHGGRHWRWFDWLRGSLVALLAQATTFLLVWLAYWLVPANA